VTYYIYVKNGVVLPTPKSETVLGQIRDGGAFLIDSVYPVFLFVSAVALVTTAFAIHLWPLLFAITAGFLIWAHSASYDLRNVLPFLAASSLFGICSLANVTQRVLGRHAERFLIFPNGSTQVPPFVTLLAFGLIVAASTSPLMGSDADVRRSFLNDNQAIGLGVKFNAMVVAAAKNRCWIGTNNVDLYYQEELIKLPKKGKFRKKLITALLPFGLNETDFRTVLRNSCSVVIVSTSSISEPGKQFLSALEGQGRLHHISELGWEIYASPSIKMLETGLGQ
jgi:hypothetical protein